jgi:hypothetical protein
MAQPCWCNWFRVSCMVASASQQTSAPHLHAGCQGHCLPHDVLYVREVGSVCGGVRYGCVWSQPCWFAYHMSSSFLAHLACVQQVSPVPGCEHVALAVNHWHHTATGKGWDLITLIHLTAAMHSSAMFLPTPGCCLVATFLSMYHTHQSLPTTLLASPCCHCGQAESGTAFAVLVPTCLPALCLLVWPVLPGVAGCLLPVLFYTRAGVCKGWNKKQIDGVIKYR